MTLARLLFVVQFSTLFCAACGSPMAPDATGGATAMHMGGHNPFSVGGTNSTSVGGNTAISHSNIGGTTGTWVTGSGEGGSEEVGGNTASSTGNPGDCSLSNACGGSRDFASGGGSSRDVGSGGGSSIDVATGGGISIDVATGGGSSIDVATGGGSSIDMATGGGSSIDMATGGGSSIDRATGGAGTIDLGCTKTTLTDINVYVIKDATPTGADTEGNMYVGGNLGGKSYTIGAKDSAADCSQTPPYYSLVVGGDIDISGSLVISGGWAAYEGTASVGTTGFECGLKHARVIDFAKLESQVKALSAKMTTLTANGSVSEDASGTLILKGTDKDLNVFNIDGSQLGAVKIDVPLTSSVVVNVSGTTISWPGAKMTLPGPIRANDDYEFSTRVVWNMHEATSLTIGGIALQGSILAPYATIEAASGGHVAGQVIVEYLKGNTEYHPYYFSGCITWQNL